MKKLTLTALLGLALVVAAVPAFSQAPEADNVPAAEITTPVLNELFPAAEVLGSPTLDFTPAAGGGSSCYFTCSCSGTPLKCCSSGGGVSCKPTDVIQCPQIYTC